MDNSSGQVAGWDWDFGDTTRSAEQNPVHTYSDAGSFSVTLTVRNPVQRDAVTKGDLISAGTSPVPEFSVNLTSGLAPLTISFTDSSSGLPSQWHWDFGDGTSSDEQNQIHLYAVPGVYDVSLTASNTFGNASLVKQDFISVMDATHIPYHVPSEGITVSETGNASQISIDLTTAANCNYILKEENAVLLCIPDQDYGLEQLLLFSNDANGFSMIGNDTISGSLAGVQMTSGAIAFQNFSQKIGNNCSVNFNLSLSDYPIDGFIELAAWEGYTPDDFISFDRIKTLYNYVAIDDLAYSVRFRQENITQTGPATLVFAVSLTGSGSTDGVTNGILKLERM